MIPDFAFDGLALYSLCGAVWNCPVARCNIRSRATALHTLFVAHYGEISRLLAILPELRSTDENDDGGKPPVG